MITNSLPEKAVEITQNGISKLCNGYKEKVRGAFKKKLLSQPQQDGDLPQNDVTEKEEEVEGDGRETWGKKIDFLLSVIGFAVDLANVWRFPYLCYKNGGGAFLIPYVLMLILGGIPLFYMELALGQYIRKGAITCWGRVCPLFKGVGYAVVLIAFYVDFFYNVIIAWALYYFFASFTTNLPWTSCDKDWNTEDCYQQQDKKGPPYDLMKPALAGNRNRTNETLYNITNTAVTALPEVVNTISVNMSNATATLLQETTTETRKTAAEEYFYREVLQFHLSDGIHDLGAIRWQLALCLLAVYLICYFSMWKGISMSGKVVWFTAVFPYVVLLILLIRGVTLPGAREGIIYYLKPDFEKLKTATVWVDAATQVFFSLGPGFGVLLAFASYNKFHNNVYKDALATSTINCCTSFLSGFVIFSVLGYMAQKKKVDIENVATEGPGLVFIVYPEAIATLPGSTFWALIFFMMLLTLGLDSSFGGSEAVITALSDEFPILKRKREWFVGGLFSLYFFVGLASVSEGGFYVFTLFNNYAAGYSILFAVFIESLAISWFYGVNRFCDDIKEMLGFSPGIYWKICWKFIAPLFILFNIVFGLVMYQPLAHDGYVFPWWANFVGWLMAASSMLCIPGFAIYALVTTPGTLKERFKKSITPWKDTQAAENSATRMTVTIGNGRHAGDAV